MFLYERNKKKLYPLKGEPPTYQDSDGLHYYLLSGEAMFDGGYDAREFCVYCHVEDINNRDTWMIKSSTEFFGKESKMIDFDRFIKVSR